MSHTVVIFGASGDLTRRKLIPALYSLQQKSRLPENTSIVGVSRSAFSDEDWRNQLLDSTHQFLGEEFDAEVWKSLSERIFYQPCDLTKPADMAELAARLAQIENGQAADRLYYMSTKPALYQKGITQLGLQGMADETLGARRVVVEKPFGTDLESAKALNKHVHTVFDEDQVYRIDHYLGKESVQNLFVLRFGNTIWEPLWNRNYVDHVQITVAESLSVGSRGGYYDTSGVLRDMFQNHLLQLMTITAMEAPVRNEPTQIRNEKVKVLAAVKPVIGTDCGRDTVRGQYEGYRNEEGVPADSTTATFGAIKLEIDNWRWQGVPFYLRSGKSMSCRTTQIVIQFKPTPHALFSQSDNGTLEANRLVIQVQPDEGLQLHLQTKVPDAGMLLRETDLDFSFREEYNTPLPDSYQRLLLDAMNGDASLFARSDEVELAWDIMDPIIQAWNSPHAPPLGFYEPGFWGPQYSMEWMHEQNRNWFDVCPVLH
jgi:glucose-6-phosphate 1-dehydrogenase